MKGMKLPSPAMVVALIALVLAAAGTGYAASKLAKNSVGTKQLKDDAVTSEKVQDGSLAAGDFAAGSLPKGERGPTGDRGAQGPRGLQGIPGETGAPGRSALTALADGETVRGTFALDDHAGAAGQDFATAISFPIPGTTGPTNYFVNGESAGETCTGDEFNPTAPADTVCIYLFEDNIDTGDVATGSTGDRNLGFLLRGVAAGAGDVFFNGSWAFTEGPD